MKACKQTSTPKVDILENQDGIVLYAEMPGVKLEDVKLTINKDVLKIKGKTSWKLPEGHRLAYSEYLISDYEREFYLSNDFEQDNIKAELKNGVLKLSIPKAEELKSRNIEVQAA
ncbi:MAG: HSP20 family protein [bacterium]|jgi:HSP20 family protein